MNEEQEKGSGRDSGAEVSREEMAGSWPDRRLSLLLWREALPLCIGTGTSTKSGAERGRVKLRSRASLPLWGVSDFSGRLRVGAHDDCDLDTRHLVACSQHIVNCSRPISE